MFSTPLISCSSGVATDASTSVALAPMKVVVTCTIGGTTSGYCAIGRHCIATAPSSTVMIDNTIATMGRSTKKRAMLFRLGRRQRRFWRHREALADPLQAFDDDAVADRDAVFDDPHRVDARSDLDAAERDLVVSADQRHAMKALHLLHGALRHQHGATLGFKKGASAAVLSRAQELFGIREFDLDA